MSEFAKSIPEFGGGAAGAGWASFEPSASVLAAGAGLWLAVCSGAAGVPNGNFGSKNPSGFGKLLTRSRFRAAAPASLKPGFNPTRGSAVLDRSEEHTSELQS